MNNIIKTKNNNLQFLIEGIVNEIINETIYQFINEQQSTENETNPLIGALKKAKNTVKNTAKTSEEALKQEKEIDTLISKLLTKRKGRANLNRDDMEILDKWTRWMVFLPFGHSYRKGLAKYLRSKRNKRKDPFADFRRYSYDEYNESVEILKKEDVLKETESKQEKVRYYHGTNISNLKPGNLILPPSKTGKISEKGRKKNLDVVFFTKDPMSAKIYADRAVNSFGSGVATVYEIEPQGPISVLNDIPGTTVYFAPYAKIIGRINIKKKNKNF